MLHYTALYSHVIVKAKDLIYWHEKNTKQEHLKAVSYTPILSNNQREVICSWSDFLIHFRKKSTNKGYNYMECPKNRLAN